MVEERPTQSASAIDSAACMKYCTQCGVTGVARRSVWCSRCAPGIVAAAAVDAEPKERRGWELGAAVEGVSCADEDGVIASR